MKNLLSILALCFAFTSKNTLAHNINHHNASSESLLHYFTEWHHGGPFWIIGALFVLAGFLFFKKTKD